MKKRLLSLVLVGTMLFSMGCGNSSGDSTKSDTKEETKETKVTKVEKPENIDTSWYENDRSVIATGMYVVGKDIVEGTYLFTVMDTDADGTADVTLFENMDEYTAYWNTERSTLGEEWDAVDEYASLDEYIRSDEPYRLVLEKGNVLIVDGDISYIEPIDGEYDASEPVDGGSMILYQGVYKPGDISEGHYMLTLADEDSASVTIFPNEKSYDEYNKSDRTTIGEETRAIETYAIYYKWLVGSDITLFLSVDSDTVIVVDGDAGYLEQVNMSWAAK